MTSDKQHVNEELLPICRKPTDFTIDHILNCAGNSNSSASSVTSHQRVNPTMGIYNYLPFTHQPQLADESYATTTRNLHSFANDRCYQEAQELNESFDSQNSELPFTWLQCTRYCPPKVPRKKDGPQKRQLGRHPRIPFTSHQLTVLEDKFKQSPYLSSQEVTNLSRILDLADIRVKIWFQNRRARDRREKMGLNSASPIHSTPPSSPSKDL